MTPDNRFSWVASHMDLVSKDKVLEIGCGVGLAAEKIAPQIQKGSITAIDKSEAMIRKAIRRNQEYVDLGIATFLKTDLLQFASTKPFSKILCFNINFFWTKKEISEEMNVIKGNLTKNGQIYILYGPMLMGAYDKTIHPINRNLEREGFVIIRKLRSKSLNCYGFVAERSKS